MTYLALTGAGDYAASWLPVVMIPLVAWILPFLAFALLFLWIESDAVED